MQTSSGFIYIYTYTRAYLDSCHMHFTCVAISGISVDISELLKQINIEHAAQIGKS